MCWKQEWAAAIGNLEHAKEHVKKAQVKLLWRMERNKQTLQKVKANKKRNYPNEVQHVEALIAKYDYGISKCERVRGDLEATQDRLYALITDFGISRRENSQRLQQLMGKYVPVLEVSS